MESSTEVDQAIAGDRDTSTGRWLPGHSGNLAGSRVANQKANQRAVELFDQWAADFEGGLTAIERSLLQQAARLMVRAERTHNPDIAVRASSVAQRMLASVRNKKRSRSGRPSLLRDRLMAAEAEHSR